MTFSGQAPAGERAQRELRAAERSCMDAMRPHPLWRGSWLAVLALAAAGMLFLGSVPPALAGDSNELVDTVADAIVAVTECHLHYPFVINVLDPLYKTHMCTGVLIEPHIALSTASCFEAIKEGEELPYTRPGSCDLNKYDGHEGNEEVIGVLETIVHENYTGKPEGGNNIALLVLKGKMKKHAPMHYIRSIQECTSGNFSSTGWFVNPIDKSPLPVLHVALSMSHIPQDMCRKAIKCTLPKDAICAITPPSPKRAWDKGAPLLCYSQNGDPSLVGLGSFDVALPGEHTYSPYVYTHISEMQSWIDEKIKAVAAPDTGKDTQSGDAPGFQKGANVGSENCLEPGQSGKEEL